MKRLLREPLLHFVVLGALLFGAYAWLNRGAVASSESRQVRVSEGDVRWLVETWSRQRQRPPSRDELRGLVTGFLKEELLAREARAMGLEENDAVVRRRLAQKVEFLVQDTSRLAEPTDDDLRKFYAAHPERFQTDARISFAHVFFSREKRKDAAADAKTALVKLNDGTAKAEDMGDALLMDADPHDADPLAVTGQFGREFADSVFALKPGAWSGPIVSGYGLHLVRVSELKPGRQREFAEVKTQVLDRWREQRQSEDNEKYFASLLKKYDVVLDESVKPLVGRLGAATVSANEDRRIQE